jgi:hypothetical protein
MMSLKIIDGSPCFENIRPIEHLRFPAPLVLQLTVAFSDEDTSEKMMSKSVRQKA